MSIGLNGGSLIIDTTQKDGKSDGEVTVTGIVNSGNAYILYTENSDKLNKLFESLAKITDEKDPLYKYTPQYYLSKGLVPAYHFEGVNYEREMGSDGKPKMVNGQYVYVKDKDGNYKYTKDAYTFGEGEKHYAFHELKPGDTASAGWTYTDTDSAINTQNVQWYVSSKAGTGYRAFIMTEGAMSFQQYLYFLQKSQKQFSTNYPKGTDPDKYTDAEKIAIIKELMINNWFVAEKLAQGETKGGAEVGDTYLATLTTRLENSLNAPDYQMPLYIGGRGSGIRDKNNDLKNNPYQNMPVDPTHQSGFYWGTGPEGQGDGTLFYDMRDSKFQASTVDGKKSDTKGKEVYGYTNWSSYENAKKTAIFWQPDNSSPFLTVGYGRTSLWDDAAIDGATTVGFIQEKNLANSSLKINSGRGEVKLQGDIGKSKALDTVSIESTNAVTVGTDNNNVTDYYHGTIYVDHGLYISGNGVKVGGEIHSGESEETDTSTTLEDTYKDNVTILSSGNIEVHGITSNTYDVSNEDGTQKTTRGGKISLTSTGDSGKITLGAGVDYDGNATAGTIAAGSSDNGAVIIDAQGKTGAFINSTDPKSPAITTAPYGTWQVYVASPSDYGTVLGDNLNSDTNAQWSSESTKKSTSAESDKNAAGKDIGTYTDHTHNKFIFQVTPTITVSGQDMTKTYGDTLFDEDLRNELTITSATFKASDDTSAHSVDDYSKNFQEASDKSDYIASTTNATDTGLKNISVSSKAQDATATRTGGYKESSTDNKKAIYLFNVEKENAAGLNGYALDTKNADIEIIKRKANITGTGTQTYGGEKGKFDWTETEKKNIAPGSNVSYTTSVKSGSAYTDNRKDRNTADSGTYKDSVSFDNLKITDSKGNDVNIADNYDLTTTGTINVAKAKLTLTVGNTETTYGTAFDPKTYSYTLAGNTNGDSKDDVRNNQIEVSYSNGGEKSDPNNSAVKTQNAGDYDLTGTFTLKGDTAQNYEIDKVNPGNAIVRPKDIYIRAEGNGFTLNDVTWTKISRDSLVNGDSWGNDFTLRVEQGNPISYADKTFGIKAYVNGQPVSDGTQSGNYIYHPSGIVQLTFNPIVKPDVWAHSGGYRPRNKIETSLPVFRVEDAKAGQYGTYGVEHNEEGDKLVLSATGMRLPEPDQVPDEERTFTTTLSTETGSGTFQLVYNGVSLKVYPQDKEAEETVRAGDKTKNVSLSEKALYVGYTEMGLDLIDLKGVYIYFN